MSLIDEVAELNRPHAQPCAVGALLDSLDAESREEYERVLENAAFNHSAIARAITNRGQRLSHKQVARHRKGECACRA